RYPVGHARAPVPERGGRTMTRPGKLAAAAVAASAVLLATAAVPADQPRDKNPPDASRFVAFDGFDGKPALNWKPVRPDESHLSYRKHPGQLTIVTQKGTIHGDAEKADPNLPAKN